jgi:AAA15 family ATPase/GTPase
VVEALRLIEPHIERISFTGGRTSHSGILARLRGEETPAPLDSMGDGVRRLLAMIIDLVGIGQGTLLIDEIDTGLYYATLKEMWRVVIETSVKQDAQVFATTHSWDCVQAFQQALRASTHRNEGSLIRLDRANEQVTVTTYTADELDIAIPQGIEVR